MYTRPNFIYIHTQVNCPMPAVKMLQCGIRIQLKQIRPQYPFTGHQYFDCVMSFLPQFCCHIGRSFHRTTSFERLRDMHKRRVMKYTFWGLIASSFRNAHIIQPKGTQCYAITRILLNFQVKAGYEMHVLVSSTSLTKLQTHALHVFLPHKFA